METFNREDAEAICKIPLSHRHVTNVVVWLHNKDGVYTVKSGYLVARKVLRSGLKVQQVLGSKYERSYGRLGCLTK